MKVAPPSQLAGPTPSETPRWRRPSRHGGWRRAVQQYNHVISESSFNASNSCNFCLTPYRSLEPASLSKQAFKAVAKLRPYGDHRKRPFLQVVLNLLQEGNPDLRVQALFQGYPVDNAAQLLVLIHHLRDPIPEARVHAPQMIVSQAFAPEAPIQTVKLRLLPDKQRAGQLFPQQVAMPKLQTLSFLQSRKQFE